MSIAAAHNFGTVRGLAGGDVKIEIGQKARKNLLSLVVSYLRDPIAAAPAAFHGRFIAIDGRIPDAPDVAVGTDVRNLGRVLQDIIFHDPGPHSFFFPIMQLEGNVQTDEGGILTLVLCVGQDGAAGAYVPVMNASGRTVFGENLAGQSGIPTS